MQPDIRLSALIQYGQAVPAPRNWQYAGSQPDYVQLGMGCYADADLSRARVLINHIEAGAPDMGAADSGGLFLQDRGQALYVEWRIPSDISTRLLTLYYAQRIAGISPASIPRQTRRVYQGGRSLDIFESFQAMTEVSVLFTPARPVWQAQHFEVKQW